MCARYRKTVAGFIWVVLNPILLFLAQATIFKYVLKIDVPRYFVFILSGLLPWTFIISSFHQGVPTLQNSRELLKSFKISPVVLVSSLVLDNFINFIAALFILLVPALLFGKIDIRWFIFLPLPLLTLLVFVGAAVTLLARIQLFFRDTSFVLSFVLNLAFFVTPIFYPKSFLPERYQWIAEINPLYLVIEPFVVIFYKFQIDLFVISQLKATVITALALYFCYKHIQKRTNEFYARL